MSKYLTRLISLILSFSLILEQGIFAQGLDLSHYLANPAKTIFRSDNFRPPHLRCISYNPQEDNFSLRLDKGSLNNSSPGELEDSSKALFNYFLIGLALPNDAFWVNLSPDSPDNIIDDSLARTDIGKIMLETDLQLKKDTAQSTSPNTPDGKAYWDKLYQKAEELYGSANVAIPTLTRPWIVPGEIIIGETKDSAYIYKATLKVMLEDDYLTGRCGSRTAPTPNQYAFSDPRLKELNEYSTQIIRETIIPKLTKEVNSSKRYAKLRQVYYSLVLAQWFKARYRSPGSQLTVDPSIALRADSSQNPYIKLIDSGDLTNLTTKEPYNKQIYFKQYQDSFAQGEYNLQEPRYSPSGQSIRSYFSGGEKLNTQMPPLGTNRTGSITIIPCKTMPSSPSETERMDAPFDEARKLAIFLTEKLALPPLFDHSTGFSISGKMFKFLRNKDSTVYALDSLVLLPLVDHDSNGLKRLTEELDLINNGDIQPSYAVTVEERAAALIKSLVKIGGEYYLKNNPNILLVPPFSAVPAQPVNPFSAFMIAAMLESAEDFKNATVIDAGSGAGLLSLVALRLGARNVVLIEKSNGDLQMAKVILEAHDYKEGKDFIRVKESLKIKPEALIDRVKNNGLDLNLKKLIGLANIGPWLQYENANNMAIKLFIQLGVGRIINGGYTFNFDDSSKNILHIEESTRIVDLLAKTYGYEVEKLVFDNYCLIRAAKTAPPSETNEKPTETKPTSQEKSSSSVGFGGIDFRNLPIVTQARSNLSANIAGSAIARLKNIDLNQEWLDIQNLTRAGILPSPERIKEYLQGLCLKDGYLGKKKEDIILCLADILRLEEENYLSTDALLKNILIVLSSTDNTSELKEAFLGSRRK